MEAASESPLKIDMSSGKPLIWNEEASLFIRSKYRILGRAIGPLPKVLNKSGEFGLPLMLMNEEAKLLVDKGYAELVEYSALKEGPSEDITEKCRKLQNEVNETYCCQRKQTRIMEIERLSKKILKGKQKKQAELFAAGKSDIKPEELSVETVTADLIKQVSTREEKELIQIHTEHPFLTELAVDKVHWSYPQSEKEKLKYKVFRDLWEKGYYLSCGNKFGGDYLAYGDDPKYYHASFIIKCLRDDETINPKDIVLWARIGTMTQKTLVLCSVDEQEVIHYQSVQWPGKDLDTLE